MTWPIRDKPPPPQSTRDSRPGPWPFLAFLVVVLMAVWLLTRAMSSATPVIVQLSSPAPIGTPAPLIWPSVVMVQLLETPTAIPTETPLPKPTSTPDPNATSAPLMCSLITKPGELCTQPPAPTPAPTAVLPCPVAPSQVCIFQGGETPSLPTATPMSGVG